jgi:mono/diheme cytochrome c family protein
MFIPRLAVVLVLACTACASQEPAAAIGPPAQLSSTDLMTDAAARGGVLVSGSCAGCHATGRTGASPMAAATPFREIVRRYPLDQLEEGFAEGLVTAHPAMPSFVFRASEIDDLIAYLETVKAERP